jgi:enoyl-CoA hydratase
MTLHETVGDGVATITMDNPPVNALGVADTYGLATLLDGYRGRSDVRAVVLTAKGRGFCAGVDIKEIQAVDADGGYLGLVEANRACAEAFRAVYECAVPVVAAVNGFCLGTGIGLVGNADVIVATEGADFGLPEVDNGALGAATHLMRLVPAHRARWMLYSCEPATAEELHDHGSVLRVVAAGDLATTAAEVAATIASKDSAVMRAAKASMNGIDPVDVRTSYRFEQGFTFELNLLGRGDEARSAFLRGERNPDAAAD